MNSEKRQALRIQTSQPIEIYHADQHKDQGKMIDISIQGSGFIANHLVDEGEDLYIQFRLANSLSLMELKGRVTHSNKVREQYLVGLEFIEMDSAHQYAINEFISRHQKMKF